MSKSFRFFIIALALTIAGLFLWPSYVFYVQTPENLREMVLEGVSELSEEDYSEKETKLFERAKKVKPAAVALGLDIRGGISVVIEADFTAYMKKKDIREEDLTLEIKKEAIEQIIQKILDRINPDGLKEITIRRLGETRISVQIPGESNFENIIKLIESVGELEFKLVDEESTETLDFDPQSFEVFNAEEIIEQGDREIIHLYNKDEKGITVKGPPLVIFSKVEISGERLKNAGTSIDEYGGNAVSFELDSEGGKAMGRISGENINRRMAIILDGKIMSAPTFEAVIFNQGQITGRFTYDEARRLALVLKTGSLPTDVKIISKDIVGPSMGIELLNKSFKALLYGILIVITFMILRYRISGIVASMALMLNGTFIFAILGQMGFTVSLPSVAGLILTMGMAIDANVLIFERIREEIFVQKKNFKEAISEGYRKAFWSIFDANFTTLIAAFILSSFGEGSVEGFAVTLIVGILMSMFTALFMVRFVFEVAIYYNWVSKHSWIYL